MCSLRFTTLSPLSAEIGMISKSGIESLVAKAVEFLVDLVVDPLVVVDEVHLVHGQHDVGDPQQRQDHRVTTRLLGEARRASARMRATSAVEAAVTMLRVYCRCTGVSAMMKRRAASRSSGTPRRW